MVSEIKSYKIEELQIGTTESFEITVTEQMQKQFASLCGDYNPLHIEKKYALERGFSDVVVYGMLTASFYSTLVGMYLPGKYAIFQECKTSFHKPVYVGDCLTVTGTVTEINTVFKRIQIKAKMVNQKGIKVSKATLEVGFLENGENE